MRPAELLHSHSVAGQNSRLFCTKENTEEWFVPCSFIDTWLLNIVMAWKYSLCVSMMSFPGH